MRKIEIVVALWALVFGVGVASAQVVIPTPVEMTQKGGQKVKITRVDAAVDSSLKLPDEGYTLEINGTSAILRAKTEQGLVWANSTLAQLKDEDGLVPVVKIKDYPAFPIRGFMNDCGRNFRPVHLLKEDIDLLSFYKMNVFHWHLTDNPAWRIESKAYPVLNAARYHQQTRNAGMFYTYDEIREVMRYAKERGFKLLEASFELMIPLVVAKIVDVGIAEKDTPYIVKMC
ncbi:MAG: family 20 glycosylhydrolase, partial [Alistipes sp.]|nr:family 20 glycosylhydrolase [Alistipes sp.]